VPGERWAPSLSDVARHIPTRTRDFAAPGSDKLLGTFTERTTPTAESAQADIDAAVRAIIAEVGELPAAGDAGTIAAIEAAARDAAEWRAAADIEVSLPNRDATVQVYRDLDARANSALARLKVVLAEEGSGQVGTSPQWAFPAPVTWGDDLLL
jgi:hypothetical protein